jgi:hypothetical protein
MKFGSKFHLSLAIFLFTIGLATIILGINEATVDALDHMGSNYWLAYSAAISGIATLLLASRQYSARNTGTRSNSETLAC